MYILMFIFCYSPWGIEAIEELRDRVNENTSLLHTILRRISKKYFIRIGWWKWIYSHYMDENQEIESFKEIDEELGDKEIKSSKLVSCMRKRSIIKRLLHVFVY